MTAVPRRGPATGPTWTYEVDLGPRRGRWAVASPPLKLTTRERNEDVGNLSGMGGDSPKGKKQPPSARQLTQLRTLVATADDTVRAVHSLATELLSAGDPLVTALGQARDAAARARVMAARR